MLVYTADVTGVDGGVDDHWERGFALKEEISPVFGSMIHVRLSAKSEVRELVVPRVLCHIYGDDPRIFAQRFAYAFNARRRAVQYLRFTLICDNIPDNGLEADIRQE